MNIYLDIDGVLLTKNGDTADHLQEFLVYVTENHVPYWLTTHCKGDSAPTIAHFKRKLPVELHHYLEAIKPTDWDVLKTDGIDFTQDFRWLDDSPMQSEESVLKRHDALDKLLLIDLKSNPDHLRDLINKL